MQFAEVSYSPLLFQRAQELRAIAELSTVEKSTIFPTFRVRPWMNSKLLDNSLNALRKAMDGAPFACDMDDWWTPKGKERDATKLFQELRSDTTGTLWYEFVREYKEAIPCIRLQADLDSTLEAIHTDWMMERGFGIVITERNFRHFSKVPDILNQISHSNFYVLVDAGWALDPLQNVANTATIVSRILDAKDTTTIFISCSSFPESFTAYGINSAVELKEVSFFDAVKSEVLRNYNRATIGYSDWATTRLPSNANVPMRWVPRIDVPEADVIRIYRSRVDDGLGDDTREVCVQLAKMAVQSPDWKSPPPSWGHYQIDLTAAESEYGVYSPQRNTASRINMHISNRLAELVGDTGAFGEEPFDD